MAQSTYNAVKRPETGLLAMTHLQEGASDRHIHEGMQHER